MNNISPKITLWYDGQNPLSEEAKFVEIYWDGRLSVKRVYTSEDELA
jgi:hypothetical protein